MILSFVAEHAAMAAFLWSQRATAQSSPLYDLADLAALDDRVEAHLDGLRVAGPTGLEIALAAIADDDPGTVFTAGVLALEGAPAEAMGAVLDAMDGSRSLEAAFIAACDWVPFSAGERLFALLSGRGSPAALRRLGLEAYAAHRHDPGPFLANALAAPEPELRGTSLRAVGLLGLDHWVHEVSDQVGDDDPECALWAAWSTALLGGCGRERGLAPAAAARRLCDVAVELPSAGADAIALALRILSPPEAREWLRGSFARGVGFPTVCAGIAATGDADWVPFLIDCLRNPERSRLAAQTLTDLLGVEVREFEAAENPASPTDPNDEPDDADVTLDAEEGWPWPDVDAFGRACELALRSRTPNARLTRGQPRVGPWSRSLLAEGDQRTRHGAALDVAMAGTSPVFPVVAPAARQRRTLADPRGGGE